MKALWKHQNPDLPQWLYSELDEERMESRKIEIFLDGRWGYAGEDEEVGGTGLGKVATPPLDEINRDPQFEAVEITSDEFERLWAARRNVEPRGCP
jgi:hypothetical protein